MDPTISQVSDKIVALDARAAAKADLEKAEGERREASRRRHQATTDLERTVTALAELKSREQAVKQREDAVSSREIALKVKTEFVEQREAEAERVIATIRAIVREGK